MATIKFPKDIDIKVPNVDFGSKALSWIMFRDHKHALGDNYPPTMEEYMKGNIKLSRGEHNIELKMFQSPRGLRFNDKRADTISVKFKCKNLSKVELCKLVNYLQGLYDAMAD